MNTMPSKLIWCDEYVTGVQEIDDQHKILVHALNEASEKLSKDFQVSTMEKIVQDLLSYAIYHFETEEELMDEHGYLEDGQGLYQTHLDQHRSFSSKVVEIHEGLKIGTPVPASELLEFLNQWLVNHILNTDKKLASFLLTKMKT
uniref:Putative Hemerythrin-like metal-binding protein n=1 Tax=Magnetococcus massalia (strain MO-1) TaxID=451514 RepID=A0A1S7LGG1_MAGMO|nr:putative Hemerythrin-like metal-binding protein [Candidatus Magnetococcus massalia]